MIRILLITIASMLLLTTINGQIITDRPDQTESSSTVGKGDLQLESGMLVSYVGEGLNSTRQILLPTNLFRFGITEGVELRMLSQLESFKSGQLSLDGISDFEIGTKIQILKDETKNTEIAFLSHLVVPSGTSGVSSNEYGVINKLSISHSINENVGVGYNLGYNYLGGDFGDLTYSLAFAFGVNQKVGVYFEPYGEVVEFKDFILNLDAGFTYLVHDNLQFDFSFGTGVNQTMNYLSIGFSWLMLKKDS